jgi:hypothetical protein
VKDKEKKKRKRKQESKEVKKMQGQRQLQDERYRKWKVPYSRNGGAARSWVKFTGRHAKSWLKKQARIQARKYNAETRGAIEDKKSRRLAKQCGELP